MGIRVFPEKENNFTSRTANVFKKFRLDVRNVLKVSTQSYVPSQKHLLYLSSDQNLKFLVDRRHVLLLLAVWLLLTLYSLFICLFYTFVLASSSLGLVRLVVKYSFYNIVEVNQLETELAEGGVEGMGGKKKDKYCFVSYLRKKGELLQGERGQGGLNVISMNISKI